MDKVLHDLKDSKLWEVRYISYNGKCKILSINSMLLRFGILCLTGNYYYYYYYSD